MAKSVRIPAIYREKVRIKHLAMEPSLQGKTVSFRFDNHPIKTALPKLLPQAELSATQHESIEAEADHWDKDGNIITVHIYAICITIERLSFTIPATAAQHKSIDTTLFSANERERLDERSDELYLLARQALDLWLRIVRWKTGLGLVDLDTRAGSSTLTGGRLFNLAHGGAFYSPRISRTARVPRRTRLTPQIWQNIADALAKDEAPPIWNEYFMSAQQRIEVADLTAGIIDLAIAAESAIRQFPGASMKNRKKRISEIVGNWNQFGFPTVGHLPWFSDLKTLISVRNKIMHRGYDSRLDLALCTSSLGAVERLINKIT